MRGRTGSCNHTRLMLEVQARQCLSPIIPSCRCAQRSVRPFEHRPALSASLAGPGTMQTRPGQRVPRPSICTQCRPRRRFVCIVIDICNKHSRSVHRARAPLSTPCTTLKARSLPWGCADARRACRLRRARAHPRARCSSAAPRARAACPPAAPRTPRPAAACAAPTARPSRSRPRPRARPPPPCLCRAQAVT